jgi:hypothetical protein
MTDIEFIINLKKDLIIKINEIKNLGETPVVFFLIGTYPGFSWHHQTPPVICDMIKDPKISPIVIMVDPQYKQSKTPLLFLTNNDKHIEIKQGEWYYPNYIKEIDDCYNFRVAYQYHTFNVDNQILYEFLSLVSPNITLLWSFTGLTFCEYNNSLTCHIPEGNCMADILYDYEYYPKIVYGKLEINKMDISTVSHFLDKLLVEKDKKRAHILYGYIYSYIKKWKELFQMYRSYDIRIQKDDPKMCTVLSKSSTKIEWGHLKYRLGRFYNKHIDTLISNFIQSQFNTFREYLNNEIYQTGNIIIKLENFNNNYNDNLEMNCQLMAFISNHFKLINNDSHSLPDIFQDFISKNENKYNPFC